MVLRPLLSSSRCLCGPVLHPVPGVVPLPCLCCALRSACAVLSLRCPWCRCPALSSLPLRWGCGCGVPASFGLPLFWWTLPRPLSLPLLPSLPSVLTGPCPARSAVGAVPAVSAVLSCLCWVGRRLGPPPARPLCLPAPPLAALCSGAPNPRRIVRAPFVLSLSLSLLSSGLFNLYYSLYKSVSYGTVCTLLRQYPRKIFRELRHILIERACNPVLDGSLLGRTKQHRLATPGTGQSTGH